LIPTKLISLLFFSVFIHLKQLKAATAMLIEVKRIQQTGPLTQLCPVERTEATWQGGQREAGLSSRGPVGQAFIGRGGGAIYKTAEAVVIVSYSISAIAVAA
jgi:hypothetical protein